MTTRTSLLVLLIVLIATCTIPAQDASFTLSISAEKASVKAGTDFGVKMLMTNASSQAVDCTMASVNGIDQRFRYDAQDSSGKPIRRITKKHPELQAGSLALCTLNPGESTTEEVMLSRVFDFTTPGQYEIQVSRPISANEKDGVVKSNKITITVTQ